MGALRLNSRGGMTNMIEATVFLMMFMITFFVVMLVWQPITTLSLYPLLNNTEAFGSFGPTAVLILQTMVLVIVASALLAFFNHARSGDRPPQQFV